MRLPFAAGMKHPGDDQRKGELDLFFGEVEGPQDLRQSKSLQGPQNQAFPADGPGIGMGGQLRNNELPLTGLARNVVPVVEQSLHDLVDRPAIGFVRLPERQAGRTLESGLHALGQRAPLVLGELEALSEIQKRPVFGGSVFAVGFDEGEAARGFAVFPRVGSGSDEHAMPGWLRRDYTGSPGGDSNQHHYSTTLPFPETSNQNRPE